MSVRVTPLNKKDYETWLHRPLTSRITPWSFQKRDSLSMTVFKSAMLFLTLIPSILEYAFNYVRYDILGAKKPLEKWKWKLSTIKSFSLSKKNYELKLMAAENTYEEMRHKVREKVEKSYIAQTLLTEDQKKILFTPSLLLGQFVDAETRRIDFSKWSYNKELDDAAKYNDSKQSNGSAQDISTDCIDLLNWRTQVLEKIEELVDGCEPFQEMLTQHEKTVKDSNIFKIQKSVREELEKIVMANSEIKKRAALYPQILQSYLLDQMVPLEKELEDIEKLKIKDQIKALADNAFSLVEKKRELPPSSEKDEPLPRMIKAEPSTTEEILAKLETLFVSKGAFSKKIFGDIVIPGPEDLTEDFLSRFKAETKRHIDTLLQLMPAEKLDRPEAEEFCHEETIPGIPGEERFRNDKRAIRRDLEEDVKRNSYYCNGKKVSDVSSLISEIKRSTGLRHSDTELWKILECFHQGAFSFVTALTLPIFTNENYTLKDRNIDDRELANSIAGPTFEGSFDEDKKSIVATTEWILMEKETNAISKKVSVEICFDFTKNETKFAIKSSDLIVSMLL